MATSKIKCPECGAEIPLAPKIEQPARLAAFHNCLGKGERQVYESDNHDYSLTDLDDRLHQSEHISSKTRRNKK